MALKSALSKYIVQICHDTYIDSTWCKMVVVSQFRSIVSLLGRSVGVRLHGNCR